MTRFIRGIECFDDVMIRHLRGIDRSSIRYNLSNFEVYAKSEDDDTYYKCSLIYKGISIDDTEWRKVSRYDVIPQFIDMDDAEKAHINNKYTPDYDWDTTYYEECEDMNRYAVDDDIYSDYSNRSAFTL
jgi:hypothetical protein